MSVALVLSVLTAVLAFVFALALIDQWRERRHGFQLVWAFGMLFLAVGAACEAVAASSAWSWSLVNLWYLCGAVSTAGWLGLGTAFLLGRTRFGYTFAVSLLLAGLFTFLARRYYPDAGLVPLLYLLVALVIALAIGIETYFANARWPYLGLLAIGGATVLGLVIILATPNPPGEPLISDTGIPALSNFPTDLRLLVPFTNVTGAFSLLFGALFSTYVFMPKRRVLDYSLDPNQPGDQFLFNLAISPVAIAVNFIASVPATLRALFAGKLHSRVPATILIAIGAFLPAFADSLVAAGYPALHEIGLFLGVVFLFAGFLVSSETFREVRIPFTRIRLGSTRTEPPPAEPIADGEA